MANLADVINVTKNTEPRTHSKYSCGSHYRAFHMGISSLVANAGSERLYGLEIELPYSDDRGGLSKSCRLLNKLPVYKKTDFTIDDGVEYVLAPMTYAQIKAGGVMNKFYKAISLTKGDSADRRGRPHGQHVHVSAKKMSYADLVAIRLAVAWNFDLLSRWVAGRYPYDGVFCQFNPLDGQYWHSAHALVGPTAHNTIEFRMFEAPRNAKVALAYVEYVRAVVDYAQTRAVRSKVAKAIRLVGLSATRFLARTIRIEDAIRVYDLLDTNKVSSIYYDLDLHGDSPRTATRDEARALLKTIGGAPFAAWLIKNRKKYPVIGSAAVYKMGGADLTFANFVGLYHKEKDDHAKASRSKQPAE